MSSLKDLASLIMIPSLVKDGRLDTVKPLGNSIIHPDATGNNDGTDGSTPAEGNFTFSRGTNLSATRVNASQLIEKGRENVLFYSNDFSRANWTKAGSVLTSGQTGYDGTNDAWLLEKNSANGNIYQPISLSGIASLSFYAKANTTDWIRVRNGSGYVYFDVANGVVGGNINAVNASIISIGNGWYRVKVSWSGTITIAQIYVADSDGSISGSSGSVYIQDSQLEQGLVATDYIETGASTAQAGILENTPRLDYSGGATCPSLLLEPSRTNLVPQSEYFGAWTNYNASAVLSEETIYGETAYKIVEDSTINYHGVYLNNVFSANGANHIWSVYVKGGERRYVVLTGRTGISSNDSAVIFDTQDGVWTLDVSSQNQAFSAESVGNGWWRIAIEGNPTSGAYDSFTIAASLGGSNHTDANYQGDGTSGIYVAMAQLEAGSYPTSYIPTYGVSQTRAQDICNKTGISSLIGQTEGTIYNEINFSNTSGVAGAWSISNGSSANRITMNTIGVNATYFTLSIAQNYNSGSTKLLSANVTYGANHKVAIKYSSTTMKLFIDGQLSGSVSTDGFGNYANFYIGANQTGVGGETRNFKESILFPTALSDSELATLTTI